LRCARATGKLSSRYVGRLGGRPGKPTPIVGADRMLDPTRRGREMGSAAWGSIWEAMARGRRKEIEMFEQRIERVAVWRERWSEGVAKGKRYSYRVPKPEADYVWYKWEDGRYLGYDRSSENAQIGYERAEARRARDREGHRRRGPRERLARGSLQFLGWSWVCPGCGRTARTLYYPVHAVSALDLLGETDGSGRALAEMGIERIAEVDGYPKTVGTVACSRCHGVEFFSTVHNNGWNWLVMKVSGGLLYGREVKRPKWWKEERKIEYVPRPNARPAKRREEVRERLLMGWSYKRIGKDLGMNVRTVQFHAGVIFWQDRVKIRSELARACGSKVLQPMDVVAARRKRVMKLLLTDKTFEQIATEIGVALSRVASDSVAVYRAQKVRGRVELQEKLGVDAYRVRRGRDRERNARERGGGWGNPRQSRGLSITGAGGA
jgi:DNA-binding CsgD family transcriptional regulator